MKVGISGGGIAGIATAIALAAQGIEVEVFERRPAPAQIGAGIVCWPNACFVLAALGVLGEVTARARRPRAMKRFSSRGEPLGTLEVERIDAAMAYSSLAILRSDLHDILLTRLARLGVEPRYGAPVAAISCTPGSRPTLVLRGGAPVEVDLVLGAEGRMSSPSRRFVMGDSAPVYQGFVNWIGTCELDEETEGLDDSSILDFWGEGRCSTPEGPVTGEPPGEALQGTV